MRLRCEFTPMDTWFFRESRPQGSVGNSELASVFPPPLRTLLGATRTAIGDSWHLQNGTNWRDFSKLNALQALIGFGDDLGPLRVQGPQLYLADTRLYPAPANLMVKDDQYFLLQLGDAVQCDLGTVRLPQFPSAVNGLTTLAGSKPATGSWLTADGFADVLLGKAPSTSDVISHAALIQPESRIGIGRDNTRRAVEHGMLYQTRQLRMHPDLRVVIELDGIADDAVTQLQLEQTRIVRLGGEGRASALSMYPSPPSPTSNMPDSQFAALYLLTSASCAEGLPAGIPAGFTPVQHQGIDCWEGKIGSTSLRIYSVVCERAVREGGWDLINHQARAVGSFIPAGSVLFAELIEGDWQSINHQFIDQANAAFGRGEIAVGTLI